MGYTWFVYALLSAIAASFVAIFGKLGLKGIDSNTATAIRAIVMALFLFSIILAQGKLGNIAPILKDKPALYFIILSGIAGALSWLFYFFALQIGTATQVATIDRLSIVFVIIFSALILGEKITIEKTIGVALVAAGAILIALKS